jgi:hypothetical protein
MAEIAAQGAAIANGTMADMPIGLSHDWTRGTNNRGGAERCVSGKCANNELARLYTVVVELGQAIDVDQETWPRHTEVHHRDEALTSR